MNINELRKNELEQNKIKNELIELIHKINNIQWNWYKYFYINENIEEENKKHYETKEKEMIH